MNGGYEYEFRVKCYSENPNESHCNVINHRLNAHLMIY